MTLDPSVHAAGGPPVPDPSPDPDPDPEPGGPIPETEEPALQAPGAGGLPMRLPRDNPDVETEL
jgi:hypothetical protein